jgi:acyl transferase domain-containing protein/NAD(P)-dependent dehydrogenase (short-subunit alcohol dehydrogenase family)/acyl carrier protein
MNRSIDDIAVIGIGLDIANVTSLKEYWQLFDNNIDCIREIPEQRKKQVDSYARLYLNEDEPANYFQGSFLEHIDQFDHEYFRISPREAQTMDPVQRLLLQNIFHTFDDAGYTPEHLAGSQTGIYIGYTAGAIKDNYFTNIMFSHPELLRYSIVGNMSPILPSRASHLLDLRGPTMLIDTACSSSLVSIHEASQAILNGTCSMAIAGGIKINLLPLILESMMIGIESTDGRTRAFDDYADGAGVGEGVACVLLKPLAQAEADGDHIYAVIKSTAINNDGKSSSLTAPNPASQARVILSAWDKAGIHPEQIDYIETHGTGTLLGDPVEFHGLTNAFETYTDKKQFCALSSAKSNIGHLFECAGIASFIKAVAALKYKRIPGMRNFKTPNKNIDFCDSPFYINTNVKKWDNPINGHLRTCGISAFGLSGTNCHVVIQEYINTESKSETFTAPYNVLCLSAKSDYSLQALIHEYETYITNQDEEVSKIAACANLYREHLPKRLAITFKDKADLQNKLHALAKTAPDSWMKLSGVNYNPNAEVGFGDSSKINATLEKCNELLLNFNQLNQLDQQAYAEDELSTLLAYVAQEYCNRSVVDWTKLYKGIHLPRMSLPLYPFQKTPAWVPIKEKPQKKENMHSVKDSTASIESKPFDVDHYFYERCFVESQTPSSRHYMSNCLFIYREDHVNNEMLRHLKAHFLNVNSLPINVADACQQGMSSYFSKCYKNIDFSQITHILLASDLFAQSPAHGDELTDYVKFQMFSIIELYKQLIHVQHGISIAHVTDHAFLVTGTESYLRPESTTLFGLGKAFNREYRHLHMYTLDVDAGTDMLSIVNEFCNDDNQTNRDIVLYRENKRFIEGIREKRISENNNNILRNEGVYLVTGGLGGIGFETALELSRKARDISLVLIGRSQLPYEAEWDVILQAESEGERALHIKRLLTLRKYAKSVQYVQCDVANEAAVTSLVEEIRHKYGKLNGVIHAAGVGGGVTLDQLSEDRVMSIVKPKIIGTFLLDTLTRGFNPDFFVMYSSNSTVFSSSDLPDYIAGNMYLDAYSSYRKQIVGGLSLTINWATWLETGMSVKHNFTVDTLTRSITTADAMNMLFTAMKGSSASMMIAQLNLKNKIALLIRKYPVVLSPNISASLDKLASSSDTSSPSNTSSQGNTATSNAGYSETEKIIGGICCNVLGYEDIDIVKNFFELGADSIMLTLILRELNEVYQDLLNITDMFSYPTVKALSQYVASKVDYSDQFTDHTPIEDMDNKLSAELSDEMALSNEDEEYDEDGIAIIGVGLDLPNASDLNSFWEILFNGINVVRDIPDDRAVDITKHLKNQGILDEDLMFRKMGYLDRINQFDYSFFGISPREASIIDPVNRLFMQCSAKAIDDSGYGRAGVKGTRTAIFLGYSASNCNTYSRLLYETDQTLFNDSLPVNQVSMAASRVAYVYDLKGPSMVIDTACSSSLVTLHMACEEIRQGRSTMALAGGAFVAHMPLDNGSDVGFESQEGITRAFSQDSTGSAVAEGVGVIMLKSLKQAIQDHDDIYAVIRGSGINQDGSSFGIAAPNFQAQSEAIQQAWEQAGVTAEDITYIEAHGTGTQLGDPIEVAGIKNAFEAFTDRKQVCGIGSIKTNVGHANEAAGMCGVFKLIGILQHKLIPPSLYFKSPNSNIDFVNSPLYVVNQKMNLKEINGRYLVGISGFGMSGTNAHLVLEDAPNQKQMRHSDKEFPYIFVTSAKSKTSLRQLVRDYRDYVATLKPDQMVDFCHNLTLGRSHYNHRFAFVAHSQDDMLTKLEQALRTGELSASEPSAIENTYLGQHAIVSESRTSRLDHEITINEQQQLTTECNHIVSQHGTKDWSQLLALYVKGAEVNWSSIYTDAYNKMHLPTYVFESHSCWYPIPDSSPEFEELDSYHHAKTWVKLDQDKQLELKEDAYTLIIYDRTNYDSLFTEAVKEKCSHVISVIADDDSEYSVDELTVTMPADESSYQRLFEAFADKRIEHIIHRRSIVGENVQDLDTMHEGLEKGFFDLIAVFKGLAKAHVEQDITICTIANSAYGISQHEEYTLPHQAVTLGLGKVIEQENPTISCRAIDIDLNTSHAIVAEEIFADHNIYLVGFRDNERYVEQFSDVEIEPVIFNRFKPGGVYIVTGGTDGLGLETAKYISENEKCNVILLSRSGFVDEALWQEYEHDEAYSSRISVMKEIKGNGCELNIFSCDVCDYGQLDQVLQTVRNKYGRINGIIHSAGISGAGYILRKDRESYTQVMEPKITGTWNLDQLTIQDQLDFMVLYSSGVTDGGEAGQSDYLGANAFLDAYTDYRNSHNRLTYTINWCSWRETGMSYRYGVNVDSITKAMSTKEAIGALDVFIRGGKEHRVMIGQYNINDNFFTLMQHIRNHLSPTFKEKINSHPANGSTDKDHMNLSNGQRDFAQIRKGRIVFIPKSEKAKSRLDHVKDFKLEGDPANQYSATEHQVAKVYSGILGYETLNVYDNFFEMGGDSVMLAAMHDMLDEMYPNIIRVAFLFEYCSIRSLAGFVDSKINKEDKQVEPMDTKAIQPVDVNTMKEEELNPYFELSSPQVRIYYESRLRKGEFAYNNPFFINVTDIPDQELEQLLQALITHHEMLRMSFKIVDSKLVQYINHDTLVKVDYIDVAGDTDINYRDYLTEFKLNDSLLYHLTVFKYPEQKILFFDVHHMLLDGFSSSLIQKDFDDLVAGKKLTEHPHSYRRYVEFEKKFFVSDEYSAMKEYWQDRLSEFDFSNPLDPIVMQTELTGSTTLIKQLPESIISNIGMVARGQHTTMFNVLISSLALSVSQCYSVSDLAILTTVLNRYESQFNSIVGVFTNLVPMRFQVNPNEPLEIGLSQLMKNQFNDIKNQYYQYHHLRNDFSGQKAEFYLYFNFEDTSMKKVYGEDIPYNSPTSLFDLDINIKKRNEQYELIATYRADKYQHDDIESLLSNYVKVLQSITKNMPSGKALIEK